MAHLQASEGEIIAQVRRGAKYHKSCSLKICEVQVSFTWIAKAKIYHVIDTQMEGRGRTS